MKNQSILSHSKSLKGEKKEQLRTSVMKHAMERSTSGVFFKPQNFAFT